MLLEGSCHCGAVRFSVHSAHPQPFNLCYCSICRKTAGGGFVINLGGDSETLETTGRDSITAYRVERHDEVTGESQRAIVTAISAAVAVQPRGYGH